MLRSPAASDSSNLRLQPPQLTHVAVGPGAGNGAEAGASAKLRRLVACKGKNGEKAHKGGQLVACSRAGC
jgi:hypothetical protein